MAAKSGSEVGNGYVLIKPTMDEGAIRDLEAKGQSGGKGFGGAFSVAAGNLISSAVEKIAGAAVDVFKTAFGNYANFEQLKGGVDKIFDEANTAGIMEDANNAYKELNMSVNEYLASINQVGASFAQTMGDQKGYDTARIGMKAISDYASGTGRNIDELNDKFSMITRATSSYQSIADQFSGILPATSADFLAQAQAAGFLSGEYKKLTDVPVAEYQEAVAKMLELGVGEMGLASNTADESFKTVSGSLAMLSKSWDNFLTGLLDSNADIGMLGENVMKSLGAVIGNVVPLIGTLVMRAVTELPNAIKKAFEAIPGMLAPIITMVFGEGLGGQINDAIGGAFSKFQELFAKVQAALVPLFDAIVAYMTPIINTVMAVVSTALPLLMEAIGIVVDFVTESVIPLATEVFEAITPVIEEIYATIQQYIPQMQTIVQGAMDAIRSVIETVWPIVRDAVTNAVKVISSVVNAVWPVVSAVIERATKATQMVIEYAWPVIQKIIEAVSGAVQAATERVWPVIAGIVDHTAGFIKNAISGIEVIVGVVQGIFDTVRNAIEDPLSAAKNFIGNIIETIKGFFNFRIQWPHIPLPHFHVWGSPNPLDWLEGNAPGFSIDWYAKGGFVDGAQLIGAGEAGPEMILPKQGALMGDFADAIAERIGGRGGVDIHDCTFYVRKESDIRRVASELNTLINRQTAGGYAQ